ncbi:uncharacterized protein LOC132562482 [Ylistrum balloti]|uniref:uncharacterized protein LOC132562482 n=1 Tax=Ylistrum balloti TaxID=509963 RepID=UPI0029058296|nr:uncharacterized protein LOC132562482 [Ylistrum balloti]
MLTVIGRDLIEAHHVLDHRIGTNGLPYAQHLPLGWVIIGEVCLGKVHRAEVVNVNKTNVLDSGRPTLFELCDSDINVKCDSVFKKTSGDEKPGLSIEDQVFLDIMDVGFAKTDTGQWTAPLPFCENRRVLPNKKPFALSRAKSFDVSLRLNPVNRDHAVEFMENLFKNGRAELSPEISTSNERWYLPLFGVYHPMKPDKIRMVFDSFAKYQDVSLNDVLLKGPDLCNSLLGILLRFRREAVEVTMDVEQMFYNFKVPENQRDFLRFLWHMDNNPEQHLVDYRMTIHVFGNSPSPAVATYGMRRSVEGADPAVKDLVNNNFYVDDGLLSCVDEDEAIRVTHKTKQALQDGGNLRLHKFTSNSRKVLDSFEPNDLAKDLKDLDLGIESLPIQRSLGLLWDTEKDDFTFKVSSDAKPYTKRGVLSTINSLYDPLGFASPVVLRGKLFMKDMLSSAKNQDWDDPLPESLRREWESWVKSLTHLEDFRVPRKYSQVSFSKATGRDVHIFSDASKDATGSVAYLKLYSEDSVDVSFLLAKSEVAPVSGHTIPRLELLVQFCL